MSDKKKNNGSMHSLGEISTIRDILMGEKISDFEARFNAVSDDIKAMEDDFRTKLDGLNAHLDDRSGSLEREIQERFDKLEQLLSEQVAALQKKIEAATQNDRHRIGKLFEKVSKDLLDN